MKRGDRRESTATKPPAPGSAPTPRATAAHRPADARVHPLRQAYRNRVSDTDLMRRVVVEFLRNEVHRVGMQHAVLGLSGGVDSALVAYLAAEALEPRNVTAVSMPYRTSDPRSAADAALVASATGIAFRSIDISPQIDAYFAADPGASALRRGNKMARERMAILYDISATQSALVLGTSNKTELFLGYGTIHGDLASAINPIGDLYKTQVWQLARAVGVPAQIVDKHPTADLWAGQTDEAELGFAYTDVDELLHFMVERRYRHAELIQLGFEPEFVQRVEKLVTRSQFKRRMPLIAKLSGRSITHDFRYPRDWKS
jgi:NAD+ synthase